MFIAMCQASGCHEYKEDDYMRRIARSSIVRSARRGMCPQYRDSRRAFDAGVYQNKPTSIGDEKMGHQREHDMEISSGELCQVHPSHYVAFDHLAVGQVRR